jgi:DNA-binding transcriptional MerR regulator
LSSAIPTAAAGLTVNELAKQSGAPAHVVRYYARIGLIQPAGQKGNGYRLFTPGDAGRLRFIRMAKALGFTLNEIREITQQADHGESPCPDVRRIIRRRIRENRAKIDAMLRLQTRMEQALAQWGDLFDGVPNGHSVCHLIESFGQDEGAPDEAGRKHCEQDD